MSQTVANRHQGGYNALCPFCKRTMTVKRIGVLIRHAAAPNLKRECAGSQAKVVPNPYKTKKDRRILVEIQPISGDIHERKGRSMDNLIATSNAIDEENATKLTIEAIDKAMKDIYALTVKPKFSGRVYSIKEGDAVIDPVSGNMYCTEKTYNSMQNKEQNHAPQKEET